MCCPSDDKEGAAQVRLSQSLQYTQAAARLQVVHDLTLLYDCQGLETFRGQLDDLFHHYRKAFKHRPTHWSPEEVVRARARCHAIDDLKVWHDRHDTDSFLRHLRGLYVKYRNVFLDEYQAREDSLAKKRRAQEASRAEAKERGRRDKTQAGTICSGSDVFYCEWQVDTRLTLDVSSRLSVCR